MIIPVMFLILQVCSVFAATGTTAAQAPAYADYSSLWTSLLTNPRVNTQAQAYSSPVPASKVSPQQETYLLPSYTSSQFPQNQAFGYTQLIPSLQSLYQQPTYNFTQNQNTSETQSLPLTASYPGLQNYYPSFSGYPSWSALAYSGLQPQSSASITSKTTPQNYNALSLPSPSYTLQNGLGLYGQNQQYVYPGFPLSSYSQPDVQTGLPQPQQVSNIFGTNQGTPQTFGGFRPMKASNDDAPERKENYKYSSKYMKPQTEYSETTDDHKDDEYGNDSPKSSENYKNSQTYKNRRPKYDDEDDSSEDKSSYDYAENKGRPKYTRPSDHDGDSEESYHSKNCDYDRSSPSGSSSNHSPSFSNDDEEGINNFAKQFKAFTKSDNFKSGDFSAEPSNHRKVAEYYNEPKRLRMTYSEDSYMSSTKIKDSEIPKTFHHYAYKAPKYSYEKTVDYLPNKQMKATSEKMHATTSPGYRDSVGHHSITATVTTMKKYR